MTRRRIKPKRDASTVFSPAIRRKHIEAKLRRFLRLLKRAKRGTILKACTDAGTCLKTFHRFKKLYLSGGEDAVRRELGRRRGDSASLFLKTSRHSERQNS